MAGGGENKKQTNGEQLTNNARVCHEPLTIPLNGRKLKVCWEQDSCSAA